MKRKTIILLASLATLAVIGVTIALMPRDGGISRGQFDLLKPGMIRAEVEHILLGPPRNGLKHTAIVWVPQATGQRISAELLTPAKLTGQLL
jgi:hypothetical protein